MAADATTTTAATLAAMTADDIVARLGLAPHPEGGYYRETFRDAIVDADGRAASSAILFLLKAGQVSRWHRVDAAEVWHWHAGAALDLGIAGPDEAPRRVRLGPALAAGETVQAVVPAHHWQQAESTGAWTLVGCTVAPAFLFERFEMAPAGFVPGPRQPATNVFLL